MKFLNEQIRKDWNDLTLHKSEENMLLRQFLELIERISKMTGHGELTITSYLRNKEGDNKRSFHFWARGVDFRIKDKSTAFYLGVAFLGQAFAFFDSRFRIQVHPEHFRENNQHIHLEIRE